MPRDKICTITHQYSKFPVPKEDMEKLTDIAEDYRKVKNHIYQRYSGIRSLGKLYPGYTVQNEMAKSGLRESLGMPSVYFYAAIFDALGDIKAKWTKVKGSILTAIRENPRLTPADRHYLRFMMKIGGCFENILNNEEAAPPKAMEENYRKIIAEAAQPGSAGIESLNRYLCRQVRKRRFALHTDKANGFYTTYKAYRYGSKGEEQGIFLSTKEKRKRLFIPLTDSNQYKKQIFVKLKPEKSAIELAIPLEREAKAHKDYVNEVGLSMGMWQMFTTDSGCVYGKGFGEIQEELTDFTNAGEGAYRRERENNPGRKKYWRNRERIAAKLESYVNQEINRMLEEEKPKVIYIPRLPGTAGRGKGPIAGSRKINRSATSWRRGYVRERLELKCRENSIEVAEVLGKDISRECSVCGSLGGYRRDRYCCPACGYEADKKVNAARNAVKRGRDGKRSGVFRIEKAESPAVGE